MRLAPLVALASFGLLLGLAGCGVKKEAEPAPETPAQATTTKPEPTTPVATQPPPAVEGQRIPEMSLDEMKGKIGVIKTKHGTIEVEFFPDKAPKHVANFIDLANRKFYDGTRFHRVIDGFMIQGGDPNSKDLDKAAAWGTGGFMVDGVERNVPAEFSDVKHVRGVLSMARSADPNSASSQFFIMDADNPSLDGQYSAFGKVVKGMEVVDKIVAASQPTGGNGEVEPAKAVVIESVTVRDR